MKDNSHSRFLPQRIFGGVRSVLGASLGDCSYLVLHDFRLLKHLYNEYDSLGVGAL